MVNYRNDKKLFIFLILKIVGGRVGKGDFLVYVVVDCFLLIKLLLCYNIGCIFVMLSLCKLVEFMFCV